MATRTFFTAFIAAALALPAFSQDAPAKPNFLWIIAEDFGPHLGCYGTKEVWSPNLDRMASEGMRYTHFFNGMVCSVSRSSFMTGMHATTIGAHNHRTSKKQPLPEGVRLLSHWMGDAGYFTANVREFPESCGFRAGGKTDWNFLVEGQPFDSDRWSDLKENQPFFAQVNFSETHRAFTAPRKADPAKVEIPPYYPDHPIVREDWAMYLDEATEIDRKIGLLRAELEKDGLLENTVIMFFGDNGQAHARGKQFCYEEGHLVPLIVRWPETLPVPAHFTPGGVDARLLHGIDLAPTLLALAGAPKPPKMEGHIFLGDRCEPDQEYIFGYRDRCDMTQMRIRTVRDARYRYIRNFTPWVPFLARNEYKEKQYPVWTLLPKLYAEGKLTPEQAVLCQPTMPEEELYDIETDPWQIKNLAASDDPQHKATLERLRGVLEKWIADTGDKGQVLETLEELTSSEARFDPARDWRPAPER
jgi:arylsulfatase A-like enzyme